MKFVETWKRRRQKKYQVLYKRGPSTLALIFAGMAMGLWAIFAFLSSYPVGLYLYYSVLPRTTELLGKALQQTSVEMTAEAKENPSPVVPESEIIPQISKDPTLPEGHYLSIPSIGVDTGILEAPSDQYETALRKGVWRVEEFGTPDKGNKPMILAAHRFGYLEWTQQYRLKNSFYELPKLKVGDETEIVWDQQRYKYRVTKVEEGTEISDYSSDLILYTCKFLVSDIRIVVYAKLVK